MTPFKYPASLKLFGTAEDLKQFNSQLFNESEYYEYHLICELERVILQKRDSVYWSYYINKNTGVVQYAP